MSYVELDELLSVDSDEEPVGIAGPSDLENELMLSTMGPDSDDDLILTRNRRKVPASPLSMTLQTIRSVFIPEQTTHQPEKKEPAKYKTEEKLLTFLLSCIQDSKLNVGHQDAFFTGTNFEVATSSVQEQEFGQRMSMIYINIEEHAEAIQPVLLGKESQALLVIKIKEFATKMKVDLESEIYKGSLKLINEFFDKQNG